MGKLNVTQVAQPQRAVQSTPADQGAIQAEGIGDFGKSISQTATIASGISRSRARVSANEAYGEIAVGQANIMSNPNKIETWQDDFETLASEVRGRYGAAPFQHGGTFDAALDRRMIDARVNMASRANAELINIGTAAYKADIRAGANDFVSAVDLEGQQIAAGNIQIAVETAIEGGLLDPSKREEAMAQGMNEAISESVFDLLESDPDRAMEILTQHGSSLDRKEHFMLERSIQEAMARANDKTFGSASARASAAKEHLVRVRETNHKDAIDLLAGNVKDDEGNTVPLDQNFLNERLAQNPRAFTPAVYASLTARIAEGGRQLATANNPGTLQGILVGKVSMTAQAFRTEIFRAYTDGQITESTYKILNDDELTGRMGASLTGLRNASKALLQYDLDKGFKMLAIEQEYLEFVTANPELTSDEYLDKVDTILKRNDIYQVRDYSPSSLPDSFIFMGDSGVVDLRATESNITLRKQGRGPGGRSNQISEVRARDDFKTLREVRARYNAQKQGESKE